MRGKGWVLAAVLTATAGCSGSSGAPSTLPSIQQTDTGSASPTAAATAEPTGMAAATPEGAGAFARFWYSEITRAWAERDPGIVSRLSAPGCTACADYVRSISAAKKRDERVEGVSFTLKLVEAQGLVRGTTRVAVIYDGPATRRYDSKGRLLKTEPAVTNFEEELQLVRQGSSWLVREDSAV